MAIRLNEMRRNPRTGRLERTGRQEIVGRSRGSSGGYEQGVVGTVDPRTGETNIQEGAVSNERGALIQERIRQEAAAKAEQQQQQEVRTMAASQTTDTAIASTVGPGGRPSVIRQTSGGFSTTYQGGAGYGVSTQNLGAVPIAGGAPVRQPAPSQPPRIQGTVEPAPRRNWFQRTFSGPITGFGRGFRSDPIGDFGPFGAGVDTTSVFDTPSDIRAATPSETAFVLGRGARGIGEAAVTVAGFGLARRGAVAAGSAVAGRSGGRALGTYGVPLAIGGGAALGGAALGRSVETRSIQFEQVFNVPGVDVRAGIDEGTQRYQAGSGFGRNIVESISFGRFTDRPRFERTVAQSLQERGVSPIQSRQIAESAFERRAAIRARTDVVTAIGGEVSGEVSGRAANLALDRRYAGLLVTPRQFAVRRFAGTAVGGVAEGGVQAAAGDIQSTGRVNPFNVGIGAVAGGAIAGTAGATIGYLGVTGTTPARSRANRILSTGIETGLDIIDPFERPGDVVADSFYSGLASRRRVQYSRVSTVNVAPSGSASRQDRVSTQILATPTPVRTFSSPSAQANSRVFSRFTASSFNLGFGREASAPTRSVARSRGSIVPNFGGSFTPANQFALAPTPTPSRNVAPTRSVVPSRSVVPNFFPTPSRNVLPSLVPNPSRQSTRENVPSRTPTPVFDGGGLIPPIGGFFGGGRGGRGSGRAGRSTFAPSFTALAFNIRGGRGGRRSSGFTGLEVRGI